MTINIDHLRQWIGRAEEARDVVTAAPLVGLAATLDRDDPQPRAGDALPPGAHWLYFLPRTRQSELRPDGHAVLGGFLPPVGLPRRMWAGGRIDFARPLHVGEEMRRVSTIHDVTAREGRSGALVFVQVRHEISGAHGPAVIEEHDIVYRDAPGGPWRPPPPPSAAAPGHAVWRRTVRPDAVLLFRYSALTFNGHRIHYDRAYVTEVEDYPGLIVHGPLIATLLMDLCRREAPERALRTFAYRALRPLFDTAPFGIAGEPSADGAVLWALDGDGAAAMTAEAGFAEAE